MSLLGWVSIAWLVAGLIALAWLLFSPIDITSERDREREELEDLFEEDWD